MKKVSLLMMTYNSEKNLENTLKSVALQDYPDIEIVLADGGSKDGTLEVIKKFSQESHCEVKWISEPDKGLYNAMNKVVDMATGDYLLVMNDQLMRPDSLSKMVSAVESGDYDGVHSDLIYADKEVCRYWHMGNGKLWTGWMPGHPTLMVKRQVYEKFGNYDESFKIAADYDFMVRIIKGGCKLNYIPEILVRMYYGGTSTNGLRSYVDSFKEGCRVLKKNHIKCGVVINTLRTVRVLSQFRTKKEIKHLWEQSVLNCE